MSSLKKVGIALPIPTRRVLINDVNQLPNDYCNTPGGTIFSTTPGGTRIIYDRNFLMQMRNSPLAKSPPTNLPNIPGVTSKSPTRSPNSKLIMNNSPPSKTGPGQGPQLHAGAKDTKGNIPVTQPDVAEDQFQLDI